MTGVSISCVVLVRLAGKLTVKLAQAGENRSVNHFVTDLDPDATDQCRVNVYVDLELAPVELIDTGG